MFWSCIDEEGNTLDPYYYLPAGHAMTQQWCQQGSVAITTSAYHAALNVSLPQPYNLTTSWVNSVANFDNVALSIWTLFQVRTTLHACDYSPLAVLWQSEQPLLPACRALPVLCGVPQADHSHLVSWCSKHPSGTCAHAHVHQLFTGHEPRLS